MPVIKRLFILGLFITAVFNVGWAQPQCPGTVPTEMTGATPGVFIIRFSFPDSTIQVFSPSTGVSFVVFQSAPSGTTTVEPQAISTYTINLSVAPSGYISIGSTPALVSIINFPTPPSGYIKTDSFPAGITIINFPPKGNDTVYVNVVSPSFVPVSFTLPSGANQVNVASISWQIIDTGGKVGSWACILPLLDIQGRVSCEEDGYTLWWEVLGEQSISHFEVSVIDHNGQEVPISIIDAMGRNTQYHLEIPQTGPPLKTVIIKAFNSQGQQMEKWLPIACQSASHWLGELYPNPTNAIINIPVYEAVTQIEYEIVDQAGRTLLSKRAPVVDYRTSLYVADLPTGYYLLYIRAGQKIAIKKFYKVN
ncbi:MAG: T9SS type A sorting domain-containing protein [Chlorobi bacterium]|nr:T9SS type A sorting domain-containing protein [Chlorobiota bacterium]